MWEAIKNWMAESKRKEEEQYSGFTKMLSQMPNAPKEPKAHDNIDNLLVANSLNRIAHSTDMFGNQALYEVKTKGGEKRHILRDFGGGAEKDDLELIDYLLREQIKTEPSFSDTLSSKELPGVRKNMAQAGNPFKNIIKMIIGE